MVGLSPYTRRLATISFPSVPRSSIACKIYADEISLPLEPTHIGELSIFSVLRSLSSTN